MMQTQTAPAAVRPPTIDLTKKELESYSLLRGLRHLIFGHEGGVEIEVSRALADHRQRQGMPVDSAHRLYIPSNVPMFRAPYAVGATGTGGAMVATELLAASFIDVLRNYAAVTRLGATILSGLVGKVTIPRRTAQTATYWVGESSAPTEAEATFDQVSLSPKTIVTLSKM